MNVEKNNMEHMMSKVFNSDTRNRREEATMSRTYSNTITNLWIHTAREFQWNVYLGSRKNLVAQGKFNTSLSYLDNQGEKWGDTYIRNVGLHYDDYSNWDNKQRWYAIPRSSIYVNSPYELRKYKDAAGGVTGLIGEVLTTIFLQKVMKIPPFQIAHIKQSSKIKSPDLLVEISMSDIINLLSLGGEIDSNLLKKLNTCYINDPIPLECKSRRYGATRLRDALSQLIEYWTKVNCSIGYGIVVLVNLRPQTSLDLLLLLPQSGKQTDIIKTTNSWDDSLTEKLFFGDLEDCFIE